MREIEFRGKRAGTGEWVYGSLTVSKIGGLKAVVFEEVGYDESYGLCVDPDTAGQYTGLKDRNGVKIFEGDIVCCKTMNLPVRWDGEHSGFFIGADKYWMMNDCDLTVIGNIHDNPELLEAVR